MMLTNPGQLFRVLLGVVLLVTAAAANASAQLLLNEVESIAPNTQSAACSYVEIRGAPGAVIPRGTFFFSVDGDIGVKGQLSFIRDLSGVKVGPNGLVTLVTKGQQCSGRDYSTSTVVYVDTVLGMGQTAETYMLARVPPGSRFEETDDLDLDDDGVIDSKFRLTKIDAISYLTNPRETSAYGPVLATGEANIPNAATRFPGNSSALSVSAWYFGKLTLAPDNSTTYRAPQSANFPAGGALTPGAQNVGAAVVGNQRSHNKQAGQNHFASKVFEMRLCRPMCGVAVPRRSLE